MRNIGIVAQLHLSIATMSAQCNTELTILFNAPININEYQYIWGSDLREFGLKGFGLVRVYCIITKTTL